MSIADLRKRLNQRVKLSFHDGEIVEAILLGVDPDRDHDITYEVQRIIRSGTPPARGTEEGGTAVAKLEELATWEPM